jgi:hypothetical protein
MSELLDGQLSASNVAVTCQLARAKSSVGFHFGALSVVDAVEK